MMKELKLILFYDEESRVKRGTKIIGAKIPLV